MIKNAKTLLGYLILAGMLFAGCKSKDSNKPVINFSADSSAVVISNIDPAGYLVLEQSYREGKPLDNVVSVLESPGEDDSLSMEQDYPGRIVVRDKQVFFEPEQPFRKGKVYIVSTLINMTLGGTEKAVTEGLNSRGARTQKALAR